MNSKKLEFNEQFETAYKAMQSGEHNLFITGRAGTGKSTLLDYFNEHTDRTAVVLAPTGVAALNVKGQTIHRFFNFYIDVTVEKIRTKNVTPKDKNLYEHLQTIIIDEVSMLRADLLDCIAMFLQLYGPHKNRPFGGVQMIFIGDLHQLPPVVNRQERELFARIYPSPYFFSAHSLQGTTLTTIELTKVYRQTDDKFIRLLNNIRDNRVDTPTISAINQRVNRAYKQIDDDFYISLTTTNKQADSINQEKLESLDGKSHRSNAMVDGEFGREYFPTLTELQLKVGAQVMLLNNDSRQRWVNGSIGIIEKIVLAEKETKKNKADLWDEEEDDDEDYIVIKLQGSNKRIIVTRYEWEVYKFSYDDKKIHSESVGTFTQYPIRLAWAITIHKSQGKTFDKVVVDLGRGTFVAGQLYVALSRCTSLEGIILRTPIQRSHVRSDPRITRFLKHGPEVKPNYGLLRKQGN